MRIAVSGTHRVGKSTLVDALVAALPTYRTVEEPYVLLEEEGNEFPDFPTADDFEAQLERSLRALRRRALDVVFDRCPADIMGYLLVHDEGPVDIDRWFARAALAMRSLDLVVLVPIEDPDRIGLPATEDRPFRSAVERAIEDLLADDELGYDGEVLRVRGAMPERIAQVLARVRAHDPSPD